MIIFEQDTNESIHEYAVCSLLLHHFGVRVNGVKLDQKPKKKKKKLPIIDCAVLNTGKWKQNMGCILQHSEA